MRPWLLRCPTSQKPSVRFSVSRNHGDLVMIFADAISRTWDQITTVDSMEQRDNSQRPVIVRQSGGNETDPGGRHPERVQRFC